LSIWISVSPEPRGAVAVDDQIRFEAAGLQIGVDVGDLGHVLQRWRSFCDHERSSCRSSPSSVY
jgi:hypothetical protein